MTPQFASWGNLNLYAFLVCLFLAVIIFLFVIWRSSKQDIKANATFDIAFINLGFAFAAARIIGMLGNVSQYNQLGWGILPFGVDDFGNISFTLNNPWSFFNFADGNFFIPALILGLLLAVFVIFINSDQKKSIFLLLEKTIWAYLFGGILLLVGLFLGGYFNGGVGVGFINIAYLDGSQRFPLQLLQIALLVGIGLVIFALIKANLKIKREVLVVAAFLTLYGVGEYFLRFYADGYSPVLFSNLDFFQALELIIAASGLLLFLGASSKMLGTHSTSQVSENTLDRPQGRTNDIRSDPRFIRRNTFAMSFSDRQSEFIAKLPLKEKLFPKKNPARKRAQP